MVLAAVAQPGVHLTFGTFVALGGIVSLLIVAAGIVGASFRVGRNTSTVANYREAAQSFELKASALEDTVGDQKKQIKVLQDSNADKDIKIASLQEQITSLRELLLQRAAFETLQEKIAEALTLGAENRALLKELVARGQSG